MKKLIRQIRSYGSLCDALVCMLAICQKPEGAFKAPTYLLGGSDSSHPRQGGFLIIFFNTLMSVVKALLAGDAKKTHRENRGYLPIEPGIFIHSSVNFFFFFSLLSSPKDLPRP